MRKRRSEYKAERVRLEEQVKNLQEKDALNQKELKNLQAKESAQKMIAAV